MLWRPISLVAVFIIAVLPLRSATAQMFSYNPDRPRAIQAVSLGYTMVDFSYDGDGAPNPSFEFDGPLYGATYSRPNFHLTFAYGRDERTADVFDCIPPGCPQQTTDLRMLDASVTTWGELLLAGAHGSGRLFLPILLHSSYRRVAPKGREDSLVDAFNITVLGLGTGLGGTLALGEGLRIEGRATPIIGLALRAFGDSAGSSRLIDTNVALHAPSLIGRFGVSAGYGYRGQVWNVSASSLFPDTQDDLFDYTGTAQTVSLGVNW